MTLGRPERLVLLGALVMVVGAGSFLLSTREEAPLSFDCLQVIRDGLRGIPIEGRETLVREISLRDGDSTVSVSTRGVEILSDSSDSSESDRLILTVTSADHLIRLDFDPPLDASEVTLATIPALSTASSDRPFLFFAAPGEKIVPERAVRFDFQYDGRVHEPVIPLEDCLAWSGKVATLALRFMYTPGSLQQKPARLELGRLSLWLTTDPLVRARFSAKRAGVNAGDDAAEILPSASIDNEIRPVVYAASPSRLDCPVTLPDDGFLDVEFGMLESSWSKTGDGVTFVVSFVPDEGSTESELFSRHVDPKSQPGDCRWHRERISLGEWGGTEGSLVFETRPGPDGDTGNDYAVWSNLDLLRREAPSERPRSVILVCLDTLRADRLSCYGYSRPTSPNLDALASSGVLFETAISQAPETLASHMSLFTALYPREHRVWDVQVVSDELPFLVESFRTAGYRTAAFTEDGGVSPIHGFHRGFQAYHSGSNASKRGAKRVEETFRLAREWVRDSADRPFFLFVHTYETHTPYDPPKEDLEKFAGGYTGHIEPPVSWAKMESLLLNMQSSPLSEADFAFVSNLYDAGIHHVDSEVGRFFAEIESLGETDSTVRVILSDHGEDFWDHFGFATHGHTLYDELIRVPLIMAGLPGLSNRAGLRVSDQVQLIDVLPTLLDLLDIPHSPDSLSGKSFGKLLKGASTAHRTAFAEDHTLFERYAVRAELSGVPYKLIRSPGIEEDPYAAQIRGFLDLTRFDGILEDFELYRLDSDPGETENLWKRETSAAARSKLETLLDGFLRDHPLGPVGGPASISDDHKRKLEALGYVQEKQADEVRQGSNKETEESDAESDGGG